MGPMTSAHLKWGGDFFFSSFSSPELQPTLPADESVQTVQYNTATKAAFKTKIGCV